jgi:hypothetical protein
MTSRHNYDYGDLLDDHVDYVDLSDNYVDLSNSDVDLSEKCYQLDCINMRGHIFMMNFVTSEQVTSQQKDLTSRHNYLTSKQKDLTSRHSYLTSRGQKYVTILFADFSLVPLFKNSSRKCVHSQLRHPVDNIFS